MLKTIATKSSPAAQTLQWKLLGSEGFKPSTACFQRTLSALLASQSSDSISTKSSDVASDKSLNVHSPGIARSVSSLSARPSKKKLQLHGAMKPNPLLPSKFSELREFSTKESHFTNDSARLALLVQAYQKRGHEFAKTDPLNLPCRAPYVRKDLIEARSRPIRYQDFGFSEEDLDKVFQSSMPGLKGFIGADSPQMTLRQMIERLEEIYCGSIGVQLSHINNPDQYNYILERMETPQRFEFDSAFKKRILKRTMRACIFEKYFNTKFSTTKRFGIDGCETAVTMLKGITKKAVCEDVHAVLIGMPHRGRLNILTNVLHKPMKQLMNEFQGFTGFGGRRWGNTGDVKYHLGVYYEHFDLDAQKSIHLSVSPNPSHLEAIDALVLGQSRAKQYFAKDSERKKVLPILMHGDASFSGQVNPKKALYNAFGVQGVVYETLQMSQLPNYTVGGTIHIIVNNRIGFTTNVSDQSSGQHCSDIAKCIDAPIFHVNADDPEACAFIAELALDYRQKFGSDVVIDLVGYRRYGHNELDMPKFTQPVMYDIIDHHPSVLDIYSKKLIDQGVVTKAELEAMEQECLKYYNEEYEASKRQSYVQPNMYRDPWKNMAPPTQTCLPQATGVDPELLKSIGEEISTIPQSEVHIHPTLKRIYKARNDAIKTGSNIDFGFAEALAFGSLLNEGYHIRLAGQDVSRGTFSHRHAVLADQKKPNYYVPLQELAKKRSLPQTIEICDSPLNEYASLAYEIGYSLESPESLSIWEAQFGDFANGAQVAIDQFVASMETKWGTQCGITLFLPHGYDGQGPEHSSGRVERFLQLCDDREDIIYSSSWNPNKCFVIQQHNMQIVNCSTPANFYHVLRRQLHRGFRKPLVCMTPKRMLKQRSTFSRLAEMETGTSFIRYIPNINVPVSQRPILTEQGVLKMATELDPKIERLILCSGQVYYDLAAYREQLNLWNVGIARVEQLSPFPFDRLIDDIKRYSNLKDVVWAQEEPMNAGPWGYVSRRIVSCLDYMNHPNDIRHPIYAGRDVIAAPAGGDAKLHDLELQQLLKDAFNLSRKVNSYHEKHVA